MVNYSRYRCWNICSVDSINWKCVAAFHIAFPTSFADISGHRFIAFISLDNSCIEEHPSVTTVSQSFMFLIWCKKYELKYSTFHNLKYISHIFFRMSCPGNQVFKVNCEPRGKYNTIRWHYHLSNIFEWFYSEFVNFRMCLLIHLITSAIYLTYSNRNTCLCFITSYQ